MKYEKITITKERFIVSLIYKEDKNKKKDKSSNSFLVDFNLETYYQLLDDLGLDDTWNLIIKELRNNTLAEINKTFLHFDDIGELYEIGLAYTNKIQKKEMGKYYTPTDVSNVMAKLLLEQEDITKLADVACGTGNLIIEVIKEINKTKKLDVVNFIKEGNLYLYDLDLLAIKICVAKIELLLDEDLIDYINIIPGDFLNKSIELPNDVTVITNPPYSLFKTFKRSWTKSEVAMQSKDLYASFIDKILDKSIWSVIVSPQSFLVSDKFSLLREKIGQNFSGEIFSFDNVPGTLFNGRKHGIFNTNSANGVRASISLIKNNGITGFRLSHLIRFRSEQRKNVINLRFLRSKLGRISQDLSRPLKIFKELEPLVYDVLNSNHMTVADLIESDPKNQKDELRLSVSTSARYFTVVSKSELDRNGQFQIYAKNNDYLLILYALLSSSYVYMWWRIYDGGILFTRRWLMKTPIKKEILNKNKELDDIIINMIKNERNYLSYKKNAGKKQESIKFPNKYREKLNQVLFPKYAEKMELTHRNNEVLRNDK